MHVHCSVWLYESVVINVLAVFHQYSIILRMSLFTCRYLFAVDNMERDNFMNPEEAKAFGLIDEVLQHPPTSTDPPPS